MPYSYDYLVATLHCARCGNSGEARDMTTRLRAEPELASLREGDALPVDTANARESGYLMVREPQAGEPIALLQTWTCPHCGYTNNWARIVVRDGVIEAIQETQLDQAAFDSTQFIEDDAREIAAVLAGVPSLGLDDDRVVAILHEKLP
ncbi:hypothetical protein KIPE111705_22090 [Kibdelosporangium persicum]|uniref:Uncharacterized protein n=1 Tax=Kibdelosporangium persicum TaxID=2698649 RepID=A0ABX2FDK6_9PSEU|nr:hypothetical protein [Kibdelosporangium persicum]NRN69447.1 hypothetical protein [Kibdelosporangium persicum]